ASRRSLPGPTGSAPGGLDERRAAPRTGLDCPSTPRRDRASSSRGTAHGSSVAGADRSRPSAITKEQEMKRVANITVALVAVLLIGTGLATASDTTPPTISVSGVSHTTSECLCSSVSATPTGTATDSAGNPVDVVCVPASLTVDASTPLSGG